MKKAGDKAVGATIRLGGLVKEGSLVRHADGSTLEFDVIDRPGGVFVRKADQLPPDDLALLMAWSRVILTPERGSLEDQVGLTGRAAALPPAFQPTEKRRPPRSALLPAPEGLRFFNGTGGFSADGREYVITRPDTPKPWVNVICPGDYGAVISQAGSGYSWKSHATYNRLTRWEQDLVRDEWGKYHALSKAGDLSPCVLPILADAPLGDASAGNSSNHGGTGQNVLFADPEDRFKGTGGGHSAAAGCRIPATALEDFLAGIKAATSDPKFATAT